MWSDPQVVRHMGGRPLGSEEVWRRLLAYAGLWSVAGHGYWLIEEGSSGRFVGEAGLGDFRRGLGPDFDGAPEGGWTLSPWAHGQGFAREAMGAILAWADDALKARRSVCIIDPENDPSLRLAARLGYVEFERRPYRGEASVLLARVAPTAPIPGP
jgi:RimJ/RimL family protein N-acetyltransferase